MKNTLILALQKLEKDRRNKDKTARGVYFRIYEDNSGHIGEFGNGLETIVGEALYDWNTLDELKKILKGILDNA